MDRIGILGGSFDPVHIGHLMLAEHIRQAARLDRIIFVPNRSFTDKRFARKTDAEDILNMLKAAVSDNPQFEVSDHELSSDSIAFTVDTLKHFRSVCGRNDRIYFISGADTFQTIGQWVGADELLSEYGFIAATRAGYNEDGLESYVESLRKRCPSADIRIVKVPDIGISSSDIRERLTEGRSAKYLLPEAVYDYIRKNCVYADLLTQVKGFAKDHEKESRYRHTCGVVKMSLELAERYGADPVKAEIAAWFHDAYRGQGNLEHGPFAADKLRELFGVEDEDILNAVRYHTIGRAGMCVTEMILKIADCLEENRVFPEADYLRSSINDDIYSTLRLIMVHQKAYAEQMGYGFHRQSEEALDYLDHMIKKGEAK